MIDDVNIAGTKIYFGVVEKNPIEDPLELGRQKVRVVGIHNPSKALLPTEDLPWAIVMQPTTSAARNGVGTTPRLLEGTRTVVIFADGEALQVPMVIGTVPSIEDNLLNVNNNKIQDQNDSEISDISKNHKDQPSLPRAARSGAVDKPTAGIKVESTANSWEEPPDLRSFRKYPHNQVRESETGFEEWDNTPGNERIRTQHTSGTFQEMRPDGTLHQKIEGDRFTVIARGDNVYVEGICNIHINSDANVYVGGNYNLNVAGDYTVNVKGSKYENVVGDKVNVTEGYVQDLTSGDHFETVAGDNVIGIGGEKEVTVGGDSTTNVLGNLNTMTNSNMNTIAKGNTTLATTSDLRIAATGAAWFNVDGTFRINSTGAMTIGSDGNLAVGTKSDLTLGSKGNSTIGAEGTLDLGSTGAMSVGSAAAVRLTGSTVNVNDGGSAPTPPGQPAVVKTNIEVDDIEQPEFESPGIDFETPVIKSIEPDLQMYSTPYGTLTTEEYQNYTQNKGSYYPQVSAGSDAYNTSPSAGGNTDTGSVNPRIFKPSGGIKGLLDLIAKGESALYGNDGYDAVNYGKRAGYNGSFNWTAPNGKKLRELSIREVKRYQQTDINAAGRYQIITITMPEAIAKSGLKEEDIFNEENQDILGVTLLVGGKRPNLKSYLLGKSDDAFAAQMDLAKEWASIPRPDTALSYYAGDGINKVTDSQIYNNEDVKNALKSARAEFILQNGKSIKEMLSNNVTYDEFGDPIEKVAPTFNDGGGPQ